MTKFICLFNIFSVWSNGRALDQILEVFVKLNKPRKLDGCVVLKHFNYAMVNGTKVEVNELAGGAFKNKTLHKPMAMHENKNNLDRHMVKMGQRSSTVVDDMSINMRSNTRFMIQGAYMIVERFDRRESSFVNAEDHVELRRVSIKTQNFHDNDPLNPQMSRSLRRW